MQSVRGERGLRLKLNAKNGGGNRRAMHYNGKRAKRRKNQRKEGKRERGGERKWEEINIHNVRRKNDFFSLSFSKTLKAN